MYSSQAIWRNKGSGNSKKKIGGIWDWGWKCKKFGDI
jgi:hypothetical protein